MVNTNRLRSPQCVLPLGLCQVAAAAETAGHTVELLDLCFERSPDRSICRAVRDFAPDVIALSIRNLDNSDAISPESYLGDLQSIVDAFRNCHSGPIVLGGPGVSIAPTTLVSRLGADYAFVGEGETSFPRFLDCLAGSREPEHDCGVIGCVRDATPSPMPISMLRRLRLGCYATFGTPMPIQTKRGCALKCVYCTYPAIEGADYRFKPAGLVADEIEAGASLGAFRSVEFVDSTFNHPADHAFAVCAELERRGNRIPLHTTSINPSAVSTELLRLMERAGFVAIAASLESASDEVLSALKKGYTSKDVADTVRSSHMTSMARMWVFIFGGPGETEFTANETLGFIRKHVNERDLVLVTCGLRIYPHTELQQIAMREGVLNGSEDLLEPTFYFSPGIGRERLMKMISGAGLSRSGTVFISDIGSAALPFVQRIHTAIGLPPPYWRHAGAMMRLKRISRRGIGALR